MTPQPVAAANAAYTCDFASFLERFGAALLTSLPDGQPWGAAEVGLRMEWVFDGFHLRQERHAGTRRLDLNAPADVELARAFWNRARYWAADNNKRMPLSLYPYSAAA